MMFIVVKPGPTEDRARSEFSRGDSHLDYCGLPFGDGEECLHSYLEALQTAGLSSALRQNGMLLAAM